MKNRLMKIKTKLSILSSAAVLAASPLAFADKCAAGAGAIAIEEPAGSECLAGVEPGTCPAPCDQEEAVENEAPAVDYDPSIAEVEISEPVENVADEDTAVPVDAVKRGGDNPDEMFYTMSGGEAPVFKGETSALSKEPGQDEKGAAIEAKETGGAPQISREKKRTVALLKKGRVFLR